MTVSTAAAQHQSPPAIPLQPLLRQFVEAAARAGAKPVALAISPAGEVVPISEALRPAKQAKLPQDLSFEELQAEADKKNEVRKVIEALVARFVALLRRVFLGITEVRLSPEDIEALQDGRIDAVGVADTPQTRALVDQLAQALRDPEFVKRLAEIQPEEIREKDRHELRVTGFVRKAILRDPKALEKMSEDGLDHIAGQVMAEFEGLSAAHTQARKEYESELRSGAARAGCTPAAFVDSLALAGGSQAELDRLDPEGKFTTARLRLESVERQRAQAREVIRNAIVDLQSRGRDTSDLTCRLVAVARVTTAPVASEAMEQPSSPKQAPHAPQDTSLVQRAASSAAKFFEGLENRLTPQASPGAGGAGAAAPRPGLAPAG